MEIKQFSYLAFSAILLMGCKNTSKLTTLIMEERELEPIEIVASREDFVREPYNPSYTRRNDLLHTVLDVHFDWKKQYLLGKATLKLKPYFYPTDSLRLDAKGFDFHKVAIKQGDKTIDLKYDYRGKKDLFIKLDRTYARNEEYVVYIEYTAKPNELPLGGSAAITADKGLYFINPLNEEPGKPQQIWTQGETESSSCWFPTIDRPNERTTQEMYITIEDRFKTLSNGLLTSSNKNGDGTRTDYWVMDKPHAPYLFMMAIGEFAVVKDDWNGMLLEYYVEPAYEKDAKNIYPNTPEMLSFFSERFGVKYPWSKFSQVVVRDYVSGAMENTTAVIFGDFIQMDSRSLMDNNDMNEGIVAHEMMHHWFGDLVTCESWANLPLNESFANYSEYLWFEHKYGRDAADYIRMGELQGYLNQATIRGDAQPLIRYGYEDKEDMFDAHSYNKGGLVLHMLRNYLGDEAYFAGLKTYLEDNQFRAAEVHDLRLAFEKVTGEDLQWFFNQWFLTKGHPKLEIKKEWDAATKEVKVSIEQLQSHSESTVFILPVTVEIYTDAGGNTPIRQTVWMREQKESFRFKVPNGKPVWTAVDADCILLCERKGDQPTAETIQQFYKSRRFQHRFDALRELKYSQKATPEARAVFETALSDPFWVIRSNAIDGIALDDKKDGKIIAKIEKIAIEDPRPDVRAAAVEKLGDLGSKKYLATFQNLFNTEKSFRVLNAALKSIERMDPKEAIAIAKKIENEDNQTLRMAVAELYSSSGDKQYASFFETNWPKTSNYGSIMFLEQYGRLLAGLKDEAFVGSKVDYLKNIASNTKNVAWQRYAAASALKNLHKDYHGKPLGDKIKTAVKDIVEKEEDATLKRFYGAWKLD